MKLTDRILLAATTTLGGWYLTRLEAAADRESHFEDYLDQARARGKGVILAFWHGRMIPLGVRYRDQGIVVTVSPHRDGEMIARLIEARGFATLRGSSNRDPAGTYRKLVRALTRDRRTVAITPDGPRGPREQVQGGLIRLASRTGAPIVPMAAAARPAKRCASWDRFLVPFPWSRMHLRLGKPIDIPPGLKPEQEEEWRQTVQAALADLQAQAELAVVPKGTFKNRLATGLLKGCVALWRLLPDRAALALGGGLGRLASRLTPRHRQLARANLDRAFGTQLSDQRKDEIVRKNYEHYGISLAEFVLLERFLKRGLFHRIPVRGEEHLRAAQATGKGIIIFTGHLGNWELLGGFLAARGLPLAAVARRADDPALDEYLNGMRAKIGMRMIDKDEVGKQVLYSLKQGGVVAFLIDVNAGFKGIFVPFFGAPASTYPAVAELAIRTGAQVLPTFLHRTGVLGWEVEFEPALVLVEGKDYQDSVYQNTLHYNQVYERFITKYPEQWFWAHNRWKTKPGDREQGLYR